MYRPLGQVEQSAHCVVCLCVGTMTFKLNDLWLRYPSCWFIFTLSWSSSKAKVIGHRRSRSQYKINIFFRFKMHVTTWHTFGCLRSSLYYNDRYDLEWGLLVKILHVFTFGRCHHRNNFDVIFGMTQARRSWLLQKYLCVIDYFSSQVPKNSRKFTHRFLSNSAENNPTNQHIKAEAKSSL